MEQTTLNNPTIGGLVEAIRDRWGLTEIDRESLPKPQPSLRAAALTPGTGEIRTVLGCQNSFHLWAGKQLSDTFLLKLGVKMLNLASIRDQWQPRVGVEAHVRRPRSLAADSSALNSLVLRLRGQTAATDDASRGVPSSELCVQCSPKSFVGRRLHFRCSAPPFTPSWIASVTGQVETDARSLEPRAVSGRRVTPQLSRGLAQGG